MKKNIILILVAVTAVCCIKAGENAEVKPSAAPSIFAYDASSRTILNSDWSLSWEEGDKLTVFNVASGGDEFSDNCRFVLSGTPSNGRFIKDETETTKELVSGESSYDWYVCSPWMQYGALPGGTKGYAIALAPQQIGYNSSDHISLYDIMAGTAYGVADGTSPSVPLHHVCTLMKFTVTNNSGEAAAITGLTLDASAGGSYITGSFTMDWGSSLVTPSLDPSQMGSSKSYTCSLSIVRNTGTEDEPSYETMDTTIPDGSSVDLYMVVAPFTIPSAGKVKLTISGSLGNCELEKTMSSATTFAAGTYNTASISYTKPDYVVFTETFGANSVTTANVPSYNKSGLTTAVESHKEDYTYSVTGNASIQASTAASNIASNYSDCSITPAYVRLPATTADSFICMSNITVDESSNYTFSYNKVKGGGASVTMFGWRVHGTSTWTYLNETSDEGLISQSFTTGEGVTCIDIMVKSTKEGSHSPYTSVDNFKLVKK